MSIGIITHHAAHNYGAMLQAYSLQAYMKNHIEPNVQIIDFQTKDGIRAYNIFKRPKKIRGFIWELLKILHYFELKKKHNSFQSFLENNLDKTKWYRSYKELESNPPDFNIYITGSDQVFNPKNKEIDAFYLKFCPDSKKKVAYAPSFGYKNVPETNKYYILSLLKRFDYLSAREGSGCQIIEDLLGKQVPNVLDPVFLIKSEEYKKIANPVKLKFKNYILCYALVGQKKQILISHKIKQLTGLPIVLIKDSALLPIKGIDKIIRFAGPREFLWLFDNADFIVTDSFHGTAFSLVFKKNFFSTIAAPKKAERIISILNEIGLASRIVESPDEIKKDNILINYEMANRRLSEKRRQSIAYLKLALSNNE